MQAQPEQSQSLIIILSLLSTLFRVFCLLFFPQPLLLLGPLDAGPPRCDFLPCFVYFRLQLLIFLPLFLDLLFECVLFGAVGCECTKVLSKHLERIAVGYALIVLLFAPETKEDCIVVVLHLTKC